MFDSPSTGGTGVKPADLEGHILVVEPLAHETGINTSFGDKDAIRCNVYDITDSATYNDTLFFGTALIGSLKRDIGKRLLGKMGKGDAKPGQSAPWVLIDMTGNEKAVAAATKYMNTVTGSTLKSPSNSKGSDIDAAIGNLDELIGA